MNSAVKLAAAGAVLLTGIALAMLFRNKPEPAARQGDAPGDHLVLRRRIEPTQPAPASNTPAPAFRSAPTPVVAQSPNRVTFLMPIDHPQAPPTLAKDFPAYDLTARAETSHKQPSTASSLEAARPTTHRIVDGDSLESLARQYLGSEDRAAEILEANREQLPSPSVLPIGLTLRIPPRTPAASPEGNLMPKRELMPVGE